MAAVAETVMLYFRKKHKNTFNIERGVSVTCVRFENLFVTDEMFERIFVCLTVSLAK